MSKVLVTGGCGFIGSHIVEKLLDMKYEVIVVDNLKTGKIENIDENKVEFYNCDIRSEVFERIVSKTKPEFIIHQAAQVSVTASIKNIVYDTDVNIMGSINVINVAKNNGVKKIVFASSAAVYGEPQYLPIDEIHPIIPLSPYGLSKYTIENYLKLAKECYGIDYTILRYSNVYGPRQDTKGEGGVVAIFTEQLAKNEECSIYGDGMQTRDFVFVKDVADANVKALENGDNSTLNISTSQRISINDLYSLIKEQHCRSISPSYIDGRLGDIKHSILSNKQARSELSWDVSYTLDQGIKETVNYYNELVLV